MSEGLNAEIAQVVSVVGLLVALAAAYFAAIWPVIHQLRNSADRPGERAEREVLARQCDAYARSCFVLAGFSLVVGLLLLPSCVDVVRQWEWAWEPGADIQPIRVGAFALVGALCAATIATGKAGFDLRDRAAKLRR